MPVEVPCPGCGLRLKAPDNMVGKKAKCKKCDTQFRIPGGGGDPGESVGEAQMLSVISMPSPFGPGGDAQVPMASVASPPVPPAKPAAPSVGTQTPAASRPGFGSSKLAMPGLPAPPGAAARPGSGPLPKPAPRPASGPLAKPAPRVESPPTGSTPGTKALASAPAPKKPIDEAPAEPVKKRDRDEDDEPKSKRKSREDEDEDDDDRPRKKKSREDDDEDDDRPRAKKKSRDDDDEDDDRPRAKKKSRDDDDEDDDRPRAKKKSRDDDDEDDDDRPRAKKKSRDDDDEDDNDRPRAKKKSRDDDDEDDDDRPRAKKKSRDDDDEDDDDRPRKKKKRDDDPVTPMAAPSVDPFAFDINAEQPASGPSLKPSAPLVGGDPFAFDAGFGAPAPAPEVKAEQKAKKRDRDDDDEEDEKPRSKKKARDDDDEDKPRSKKKARDDDDEEPAPKAAAPVGGGDPFSFDASAPVESKADSKGKKRDDDDEPKRKGRDDDDDRGNKKDRKKRDDDEPAQERRYVSSRDQKGSKKTLMIALLLGGAALATLIAAVVVMQKSARDREAAEKAEKAKKEKDEKKEETPPPVVEPPKDPGKKDPPKKETPKKDPKDPTPKDPAKDPKEPPEPPASMLDLPPTAKMLVFQPAAAKQSLSLQPKGPPVVFDAPLAKIKRVFAPEKRVIQDVVVVWQSVAGVGGKGEKLTVDIHSGNTGAKVGRFEYDGDGKEVKCDLSPDGKQFVAAGLDGKISVWNLGDPARPKIVEGYDPYGEKDRAEHKSHGLAGVFFTQSVGRLLTVTTAGAAHLVDPMTKKIIEGWSPLKTKLVAGRVAFGKNLATDDNRASFVIAVGGTIYQIESTSMKTSWKLEVGEVGRHLGLGVLGVPGRIAYAFETNNNGKKEKAVLFCLPNDNPFIFRWPDVAGDPSEAVWAGANLAVIGTEKGVVYVSGEGKFKALGFAEALGRTMNDANENGHWFTTPDPGAPTMRTIFQQFATDDLTDFLRMAGEGAKDAPTAKLSDKGLVK